MTPNTCGKGQSAIEYLGITVAALAIFTPIAVYAFNAFQSNTAAAATSQAQTSVDQLRDAADTVCGLPNGTQQELTVVVPSQIRTSLSGFGTLHAKTLHLSVETVNRAENITGVSTCNVTGTFPDRTGPVTFSIVKQEDNRVHFNPQ